jgi:hypothetical protein
MMGRRQEIEGDVVVEQRYGKRSAMAVLASA